MLAAQNISVSVGAKRILRNVSLEVEAGEVVALLGANGAGKSTLLKAMCGDRQISEGEIKFENRNLNDWNLSDLAKRRAVLSQQTTFDFSFTALEVAMLGRNPHILGNELKKDAEIVVEALKMVQIEHLAAQSFPTLSGGEQQRVHLARVLAQIWEKTENKARYLLLDEPTSSLDLAHQHLILRVARSLTKDAVGVLIVLHDLNLAANYADKIYLLKDGKVFQKGSPDEVLTAANIKAVFDFDASTLEYAGRKFIVANHENYL